MSFLSHLKPRNISAFVLANVAMGATYFLSSPSPARGGAYAVLDSILVSEAAADGCNTQECLETQSGDWCVGTTNIYVNCHQNANGPGCVQESCP